MTVTDRSTGAMGNPRCVRFAATSLLVLAAVLLVHLVDGAIAYVAVLYVGTVAAAIAAARQVREDDVLGWTMAVASALVAACLVVSAHTAGLPADRPVPWSVWATVAVVACTAVLGATLARWCDGPSAMRRIGPRPTAERRP